jgi:hypothetical protein
VLVGAEPHLPYDRPPLSKDVLLGKADSSTLDVPWRDLDVDLRLSSAATGLRTGVVETDAGDVAFDGSGARHRCASPPAAVLAGPRRTSCVPSMTR